MDGFFPSYRTAAGALTVAFLAYHVIHIVYLAYFSPVSRVPGPILCRFTGAVDMYQGVIGGRRAAWMHGLHQKYGKSISHPSFLPLLLE